MNYRCISIPKIKDDLPCYDDTIIAEIAREKICLKRAIKFLMNNDYEYEGKLIKDILKNYGRI